MSTSSTLRQLTQLQSMSMAELKSRWAELMGSTPPKYNREFLISRLAHRIQELTHGGLTRASREQMSHLLDQAGYDKIGRPPAKPKRARQTLAVGTRLIREWDGQRHEVTVIAGGFEYRGQRYRSLTGITEEITGLHWSGPAFFGLTQKKAAGGQA